MVPYSEITRKWKDVSSRDLAAMCRTRIEEQEEEDNSPSSAFYHRGGREEFEIGIEYCRSGDPLDRCTGTFLLEHLGYNGGTCPFAAKSLEVIIPMLDDPDERVVRPAVWALGRLSENSSVPQVLRFVESPNEDIRYAATFALSMMSHAGSEVTASLMKLAKDPDRDIRDWATFALGTQSDEDSPEIRQLLFEALSDQDREIVAEGLQGLANRNDPRSAEYLLAAFSGCDAGGEDLFNWWGEFDPYTKILDTMAFLADDRFVPMLERLAEVIDGDAGKALLACRQAAEEPPRV
jgi:hypothetical protein